nr:MULTISPECIES: hypothetical protein [Pseudomonas]
MVNGKFVDENPVNGTPGSLIPAAWGNSITDEVVNVVKAAGLVPDEADLGQLLLSIQKISQSDSAKYALDTGASGTYVASYAPALKALVDGVVLCFKAQNGNTGASTFSPNGLTAAPIVGAAHSALQGGEIIPNGDVWVQWNSSIGTGSWVLIDSTGGALQVASATKSLHAINAGQFQVGALTFATDTGTANTYTANYSPAITAVTDGITLRFKAASSNTGASTFSPNGLTPQGIVGLGATALQGGEIVGTGTCTVVYSVALGKWVLLSCSGAPLQVSYASAGLHALPLAQAQSLFTTGRLIGVQTFTSSGTYTPTAGMSSVVVQVQGGGGAGAGSTAPSAGNISIGAGGNSGAYGEGRFTAASIGASQAITIGAGGSGASGASGGNGGTSSVGALISAPGGVGGPATNNVTPPSFSGNGTPGTAPSGANIFGCPGSSGGSLALALGGTSALSGSGAPSLMGFGGLASSSGQNGYPAAGYGGGGGGSASIPTGAAQTGGAGKAGIIIIWEYA